MHQEETGDTKEHENGLTGRFCAFFQAGSTKNSERRRVHQGSPKASEGAGMDGRRGRRSEEAH